MSNVLLKCPFCGGKPIVMVTDKNGEEMYYIQCKRCKARAARFYDSDRADDFWNARAKEEGIGYRYESHDMRLAMDDIQNAIDLLNKAKMKIDGWRKLKE